MTIICPIASLSKAKKFGLSILCGALSTLAMPPLFLWPVLFLTLPIMVRLIDTAVDNFPSETSNNSKQNRGVIAALYGFGFGFGYFFFSLYWIGSSFLVEAEKFAWALPFAVTILPAGLSLFYSLAFALCAWSWPKGSERLIVFALAMFAADWLRGHILTGFPWNLLGHSLTGNEAMMQSVSFFGLYGLTAIACLIFASPVCLYCRAQNQYSLWVKKSGYVPVLIAVLSLPALALLGQARLSHHGPTQYVPNLDLILVQPNIPQIEKVSSDLRIKAFEKTFAFTQKNINNNKNNRLIIWPETAVPYALNKSTVLKNKLASLLSPTDQLITGAYRVENEKQNGGEQEQSLQVYNSLYVLNNKGKITSWYNKHHLVPFGEYLPFPNLLKVIGLEVLVRLRGGFTKGQKPSLMPLDNAPPFLPYICYEAIFPDQINPQKEQAKWLLNISNDGWFGQTAGPYQHAHMVRLRTLESGLPMVRVVNGGITAVFDGLGRTLINTRLNKKELITTKLPKTINLDQTAFMRFLTTFFIVMCCYLLISTMKFFDKWQ